MRILIVSPVLPGAGTGSGQRMAAVVRGYRQLGVELSLLAMGDGGELSDELAAAFADSHVTDPARAFDGEANSVLAGEPRIGDIAGALLRRRALLVDAPYSRHVLEELARMAAAADLVHCFQQAFYTAIAARIDPSRIVWDLDANHGREDHPALLASRGFRKRLSNALTRRYNAAVLPGCFRVLLSSEVELRSLGRLENVSIVPNVAPPRVESPVPLRLPQRHDLVFVGTLDYAPNHLGLRSFCRDVLPLIREKKPAVRLLVAGRSGSNAGFLTGVSGLTLATDVDHVAPYYEAARVCVIPVVGGAGTRVKLLEAMDLGVPVVTTAAGCEGVDVVDRVHLLVADNAPSFAAACLELLDDQELQARLRASAADHVEKRHRQEAITHALREVLSSLGQDDRCTAGHPQRPSRPP